MVRQWYVVAVLLFALGAVSVHPGSAAGRAADVRALDATGADLLPARAMLDGYPQLYQQHTLTCEAATVSMATQGIVSESSIVAAMPVNSDPWLGFRGVIDGRSTLAGGLANYGIYAPPLAREMQDFGYQTAVISGTDAPALLRYSVGVLHLPVVVWVTYRLRREQAIAGHAAGESFPLVRYEHARLVVGYDAAGVYTHDPLDGPRHDPWPAFLRAWGSFDEMGLIVAPAFRRYDPPPLTAQLWQHEATWSWPQPAWPLADEVTIFRAGRPLHRFVLAPGVSDPGVASGASGPGAVPQPLSPPAGDDLATPAGASLVAMPLHGKTPIAGYLQAGALLAGTRPLTGTEALTLHLDPSTPYTLTVSAVDPLGVVSPAATSAPVVDLPLSAPAGGPIFPPASFFVLPASVAGGSTALTALRPQDLGSPTKPLTRVQYDIAATRLSYRVEVFASTLDATTSFAWQMAHPPADIGWLPAPASLPGARLYTVGGYVVAAVLYRNVEFAVSMLAGSGSAAAATRTLDMARTLIARSTGFAGSSVLQGASGPASIVPPPFTFIFPDLGVYRIKGSVHTAQGERFYDYSFRPRGLAGAATRDYHVVIEPSAARAQAMVAHAVQTFTASYQAVGFRRIDLTGTALADPALHAWAAAVPTLRCAVWAVFSYRNVWFLFGDSGQANRDSCAAGVQVTEAIGLRLLQSAQAYAQARQS